MRASPPHRCSPCPSDSTSSPPSPRDPSLHLPLRGPAPLNLPQRSAALLPPPSDPISSPPYSLNLLRLGPALLHLLIPPRWEPKLTRFSSHLFPIGDPPLAPPTAPQPSPILSQISPTGVCSLPEHKFPLSIIPLPSSRLGCQNLLPPTPDPL